MSTDMIVVPDNIPAYLIDKGLAQQMNADAVSGIGTGMPPSIRIKQGKFRVVDADGTETVLKPSDLDATGEWLPVVVLAAKPGFSKVYYASAYDPNQSEAAAPDCFSLNGEVPDASAKNPQCASCAGCPQNAFHSGRNQAGQPTKGKACSDNKILAVLYKGGSIYQLKVPPASLKNWGSYVNNLTMRGVPVTRVFTYISFSDDTDYPVLVFRVGDFVKEQHIAILEGFSAKDEVKAIVSPPNMPPRLAPALPPVAAQPALQAPVAPVAPPPPPPPDESEAFFGGAEPTEHKPLKSPGRPRKSPESNVTPIKPQEPTPAPAAEPGVPSDSELIAMLGL